MNKQTELQAALKNARLKYSQRELAQRLGVDPKTIRRWERNQARPSTIVSVLKSLMEDPVDVRATSTFRFVDLFAGIGGLRLPFDELGGRCVFTSEWNKYAQKTYLRNFGDDLHAIAGDITQIRAHDIPNHDLLLGGFPCQPFSIAGVSKKNSLGRKHGFKDKTQGTLFFDVARIIDEKKPRAFLLENVKNLLSHDGGRTFETVMGVLRDLSYDVHYRVIDARTFVPQHRERLMIIGFREKTSFSWDDLRIPQTEPLLQTVLHPEDGTEAAQEPYTSGPLGKVAVKYTLSDKLWSYLQAYAKKHREAGNGFGYGLVTPQSVARTLSARYFKDGSEILVSQGKRKNPRRLTPRECARLMGFPDTFAIPVSDTQAYKQFGNSVVVPVIRSVAAILVPRVLELMNERSQRQLALV